MITQGNSPLGPMEVARFAALALSPDTLPPIVLDKDARKRIRNSRKIIDDHIASGKQSYGINTGVGFLHHATVSQDKLLELQHNLILSHCVGVGAPLSRDLVLGMWIVLLNSMAQGHRGIRLEVVDFIRQVLEAGILAQVPSRGSVGASGDLAPSAHAALILFGEGRCSMPRDGGFIELDAAEALRSIGLAPLTLGPKEGLSLINGTQATTAMACKVWAETDCLLRTANLAAALSITGLRGKHAVFSEPLLRAHRHPGTLECGMSMARWVGRDTGRSAPGHNRIQDPYSLRCSPQVHGAVWEEIQSCEGILRDEINASTDNPLVFAEEELVLHGGNFHAIYPARVADRLASAIATLASISERRINLAMDKEKSGLPYFLIDNGGVAEWTGVSFGQGETKTFRPTVYAKGQNRMPYGLLVEAYNASPYAVQVVAAQSQPFDMPPLIVAQQVTTPFALTMATGQGRLFDMPPLLVANQVAMPFGILLAAQINQLYECADLIRQCSLPYDLTTRAASGLAQPFGVAVAGGLASPYALTVTASLTTGFSWTVEKSLEQPYASQVVAECRQPHALTLAVQNEQSFAILFAANACAQPCPIQLEVYHAQPWQMPVAQANVQPLYDTIYQAGRQPWSILWPAVQANGQSFDRTITVVAAHRQPHDLLERNPVARALSGSWDLSAVRPSLHHQGGVRAIHFGASL